MGIKNKNMKNKVSKVLTILFSIVFLTSCEQNEKFTGSPVDNMEVVTIEGIISSPESFALTDQEISFTATLPRTFADTTTVEATSISNSGRRTRAYVDIMPNQLSGTGKIKAAGSGLYNGKFDMFLSAINLKSVEPGRHYLIKSNAITLDTGSTSVPDTESNRLIIKFVWPNILNANNLNNLSLVVDRPGTAATANVNSFNQQAKFHFINNPVTGTLNATNSYAEGEYILSVKPILLQNSPADFPYRFVIVHPDGKVEIFQGTFTGMTLNTTTSPVLKITKVVNNGVAAYTVTQL